MPAAAQLSRPTDLWTEFQRNRYWQSCTLTPGVERWIQRYAGSPSHFANSLEPVLPVMGYVLERARQLDLPAETMLLPIVESYYRPDARGAGGALGMWQLMPDTGRRFGLKVQGGSDDRLDVQASTTAALRLLSLHAKTFSGDPKLMFAAYNAGGYRVRKALAGSTYIKTQSLEALGLSRTTREYLDKVNALGCLLSEPSRFNVTLPEARPADYLVEFKAPFPVDPTALADHIGYDSKRLQVWNQHTFARRATPVDAPMLLPAKIVSVAMDAINQGELPRVEARVIPEAPPASVPIHKVQSGDSLWTISKRYRVRLADLMNWNGLSKRSVLRIGQALRLQGGP
jgi:membrane-bound lytic murein transglycosylase D